MVIDTPRDRILSRLGVIDRADWPWAFDSTSGDAFADDLAVVLVDWVADYNETYVVRDTHLIPECWPAHPGLAREISVLFSTWATAFHSSANVIPDGAAQWFDRWLPGFQNRISHWLGREPDACRAGQHPADWNDPAAKITRAVKATPTSLAKLRDSYLYRLTASRSAVEQSRIDVPSLLDHMVKP